MSHVCSGELKMALGHTERPGQTCNPDGAQRNPGLALPAAPSLPDCAALHPGYGPATSNSSGSLSTTSWPSWGAIKGWPGKVPNRPSALRGLGPATVTKPGL